MKHKTDLIDAVSEKTGLNKTQAGEAVDAVLGLIPDMASEKLVLRGFGTFEVRHRKARSGRNPRTGEEVQIPARDKLAFRPAKTSD